MSFLYEYYTYNSIEAKSNSNGTNIIGLHSRQKVYTTSLANIILMYQIKKIKRIQWNINIDNTKECLDSILNFNHIISEIEIRDDIKDTYDFSNCGILTDYFIKTDNNLYINSNDQDNLKKIVVFLTKDLNEKVIDKFNLFVRQYDIKVLKIDIDNNNKGSIYHEKINGYYKTLFDNNDLYDVDIIIQFNPDVLLNNNNITFQINLKCKDKMLYVDKEFDIIYGNKSTMFELYNIINSEYFNEYIQKIKREKKEFMFKLFNRRYFYEYIQTIFDIIKKL